MSLDLVTGSGSLGLRAGWRAGSRSAAVSVRPLGVVHTYIFHVGAQVRYMIGSINLPVGDPRALSQGGWVTGTVL